jgi:hypothetical protein
MGGLDMEAVTAVLSVGLLAAAAQPSPFAVPLGCLFIFGVDSAMWKEAVDYAGSYNMIAWGIPAAAIVTYWLNGLMLLLIGALPAGSRERLLSGLRSPLLGHSHAGAGDGRLGMARGRADTVQTAAGQVLRYLQDLESGAEHPEQPNHDSDSCWTHLRLAAHEGHR